MPLIPSLFGDAVSEEEIALFFHPTGICFGGLGINKSVESVSLAVKSFQKGSTYVIG